MKKSRLTILLTAILCGFSPMAAGKEIGVSTPERQGFSSDRLDYLTAQMKTEVTDGTMVGGVGLIARNGKIIYEESYGQADRDDKDAFNMFSSCNCG